MSNPVYVSMSRMAISSKTTDSLITFSLGSCIGIALYDRRKHLGGLIHCMLPDSTIHKQKADTTPCMFVDTGLPFLLDRMAARGSRIEDIVAKAAGGACMLPENNAFMIGQHNIDRFHELATELGLEIAAESLGGNNARSVRLEVSSGQFFVKINAEETEI